MPVYVGRMRQVLRGNRWNKRHANECMPYPQMLFYHIEVNIRAFQCSPKAGLQRAASPLPEREVSSLLTCFSAAVGGNKENWKALRSI